MEPLPEMLSISETVIEEPVSTPASDSSVSDGALEIDPATLIQAYETRLGVLVGWSVRFADEAPALAEAVAVRIVAAVFRDLSTRLANPELYAPIGLGRDSISPTFRLSLDRPCAAFQAGVEHVEKTSQPLLVGDWMRRQRAAAEDVAGNKLKFRQDPTHWHNLSALAEWMNLLARQILPRLESKLAVVEALCNEILRLQAKPTLQEATGESFSLKSSSSGSLWPILTVQTQIVREDPNARSVAEAGRLISDAAKNAATAVAAAATHAPDGSTFTRSASRSTHWWRKYIV